MNTTWTLALTDARASSTARRITAAVTPLVAALRALTSVAPAAQAALSRVAPAGTAVQVRAVTAAIREQSKALRELNGLAGRAPRGARPSGPRAASPTAATLAGGGVRFAGAPTGRTRVELSSTDPRQLAQGMAFQRRALALQSAYRSRQGAQQVAQTQRDRATETRAHQSYFQRLSRMTQQSFRENQRLAEQGRRTTQANARASVAGQRATSSSMTAMLGTAGGVALGVVGALAGIAAGFAGVGLSAAQAVVEVAAFRESSLVALEAVLGSSAAAGRQFRNAITVANQTPLDTRDVITQTQAFAVAGFAEREIAPLIAASADMGAAFGQRSSEGFALALSQIRATGTLQGQELLQLTNANVSRMAVLDSIARQMSLGEGDVGRRAAMTAISQRRVSSGVGEQAALDAVRGRLDQGGQLGSFARRQSETLTGAISNARNAIFNLMIGIDFGAVPGIVAFKNVLLQITAALTSGSPAAASLRAGITGAANAVGGLLSRIVNPTAIAAGMAAVGRGFATVQRFGAAALPVVRAFIAGFGPGFVAGLAPLRALFAQISAGGGPSAATMALLARAATGVGSAIGFVAGALGTMLGVGTLLTTTISALIATVGGLATTVLLPIRNAFVSVGAGIVAGIVAGITGGVGGMGTAITSLGASAIASARAALGIRSPSRVFADLIGAQIPAGIAMGVTAGAPAADAAVAGIVSPSVPALGGRGVNITLTINASGGGQPGETARAIRAEVEDALGSIFGQMAEAHA